MTTPEPFVTPEAYLARERAAETKSEYYGGRIYAMGGVGRQQLRIAFNLGGILYRQIARGPCETFATDMRTKVRANGLYTYPDLVVVCGEAEFEDEQLDTLLNPTLIVEILSPSTAA